MIPADSRLPESAYIKRVGRLLRHFRELKPNDVPTLEDKQVEIIDRVIDNSRAAIPPLQRLEHAMHPLVSFVIMPIFALANAGVSFDGINLQDVFSTNIAAGVMFGLLVGKPVGIVLSTVMLSKLGIASPSGGLTIRRLLGIGFLASIGFTMSMFISTLAFADGASLVQAKLGIFTASVAGGWIGYVLLRKS